MGLKNNKKKIGDTAVDKLSDALNVCEHLDPKIKKNDTNLSWDGEIEFHDMKDGMNFSRKSYRGACHVQVKGTVVEDSQLSIPSIKHKVSLSDIKNYRYSGGAIFFVVALVESDDCIESKIYYKVFLPYDIVKILSHFHESEKTFSFDEFPDSREEKEQIICEFILDKERQYSTSQDVDTFVKSGEHTKYVFWLNSKNGFPVFDQRAKYVYKKLADGIYQAVGKFTIDEAIPQNISFPVFIDDKEIFSNAKIAIDAKTNEVCRIELNRGLEISSFSNKRKRGKFILNGKCSFLEYAQNLDFLNQLYRGGHLKVGEILEGDYSDSDINYKNIDEQIACYRNINELLVCLNVKKDVKLSQFSHHDIQKLYYLYECIVLDKPYHQDLFAICRDKLGPLKLLLFFLHGHDGGTHLVNAFSLPAGKCEMAVDKDSPRFASSLYTKLETEDYLTLDNLDLDVVKQSLTSVEYSDAYGMILNWSILEMLRAFDQNSSEPLLDCLLDVSKWLTDNEPENDVYFINYMQTIRRKRNLDSSEIKVIIEKREKYSKENHRDLLFLAGYSALLSNHEELKFYTGMMGGKERNDFYGMPIAKIPELQTYDNKA